jgi:putative restriction endonuclease
MHSAKEIWIDRLRSLHPSVSNSKGEGNARYAPHKPLLLLSILDLADSGELPHVIGKSPELRLRFDSFWGIVQSRWGGRPGLDQPFHHLGSQGFWAPLQESGAKSVSKDTTVKMALDPGFRECLGVPDFRKQARFLLLKTWFPENEQEALLAAIGIRKSEARRAEFIMLQNSSEYRAKGRDARFRIIVVTQYRFTCALSSYGCHTSSGATLVEAAHIHAFSKSHNDNPENGLALTRDAHWMFDEGLWTVDDNHRIRVASTVFTEWGPEAAWLKSRNGKPLFFLEGSSLRPAQEHLAWHRSNVFSG